MKKLAIYSLSALLVIGLAAFQTPAKPKKPTKKVVKKESTAPAATAAKPATTPAKVTTSDKAYDVKFDKTFHDFGKVAEGEQVSTIYVITNIGKEPVLISSHEVECGCTTPTYTQEPIMPGKSTNIAVGFNTNGKVGVNNKTVKIHTNGGIHELKFKCEVTAKAPVDPMDQGNPVKLKTNPN
jgi:hypothetical protein